MKSAVFAAILAVLLLAPGLSAGEDSRIRLNTIGFLPEKEKKATISASCEEFAVLREKDGSKALEGKVAAPVKDADTGEEVRIADFSALRAPGEYRLEVPGVGRSARFRIAADVYRDPFALVMRGMYLWRCGTAVRAVHAGDTFAHQACHLEDAWLDPATGEHARADGTKGWHDAGDYNKYVVNAGITVGCILRAWEDFGPSILKIRLDLPASSPPSSTPLPELLAEVRWELEWLFNMQARDGSVYHKLSTKNFGDFVLPELEKTERFFTPWSSAATADFTAMMAMAARNFRPHQPEFADRCLAAARKSRDFLKAHPENHRADLAGFRTGGYETKDPDDRLWAAAEMWETAGDEVDLRDLEARLRVVEGKVDVDFDWGEVKNLGLLTYLSSRRPGRNPMLVEQVRANLLSTADTIVLTRREHAYGRPLGSRYYWGANGSVARQVVILQAANRLAPRAEYLETALDALGYLFGRNPFGRSFVTGLGFLPPHHPHDRRSGGDQVEAPWPGYLVGGPHPRAINWNDEQRDYRTNEIAINWNAALIYALAGFLQE